MATCPLNIGIISDLDFPSSEELDILDYMYTETSHQDATAIADCTIVTDDPELSPTLAKSGLLQLPKKNQPNA
jgi:hypothetical protein